MKRATKVSLSGIPLTKYKAMIELTGNTEDKRVMMILKDAESFESLYSVNPASSSSGRLPMSQ